MKSKPSKRPRTALTDEQVLFAFVRRMEELQSKKYFQHLLQIVDFSKPPSDRDRVRIQGDPTKEYITAASINDEELLISFLATLRQFYLNDEPIRLVLVKEILHRHAEVFEARGDPSLLVEIRSINRNTRARRALCSRWTSRIHRAGPWNR